MPPLTENDWTAVNQKLALLKQQQSSAKLIERLVAVRVAGVAAAQANRDKTAQARINRMCDEAVALIKVHLADEKVRLLSEEMEALQAPENRARRNAVISCSIIDDAEKLKLYSVAVTWFGLEHPPRDTRN